MGQSATSDEARLEKFRQTVIALFTLGMDGDLLAEEVQKLWQEFLGPDDEDES